jgi:ABC-type glycerol-3-phosphate transport system substrate-binding protein
MTRSLLRVLTIGLAATLTLAACGGGGGDSDAPTGDSLPSCPLDALTKATKPVEITFWHTLSRANEETLTALTDRFNGSQQDVREEVKKKIAVYGKGGGYMLSADHNILVDVPPANLITMFEAAQEFGKY